MSTQDIVAKLWNLRRCVQSITPEDVAPTGTRLATAGESNPR